MPPKLLPREIGSGIFSYRGQFLFCDANIRRDVQSACGVCAIILVRSGSDGAPLEMREKPT
jgi:hypothetical protein